ncbi:Malate dehydrogenase, mitochondrial [Auxenochlorella protothecoides]|uniref:Malate dehydrogenase n=1 Tax=Auxenochlorella protothecoides TaxID=3075 RepID=A0A087SLQ1_AUXPR|nr:Malate dehydrogenase, mitochondrial [Auxenochlorella protothecoides]KFM26655.1 Malate dehydrogenase, mitochondrial [Auxenochlorella protothecoides]
MSVLACSSTRPAATPCVAGVQPRAKPSRAGPITASLRVVTPAFRRADNVQLRSVRSSAAPQGRTLGATVEAKNVALLGAAGGIGQPLALLLKLNPQITELRLYDIANVKGVAADLSHINTSVKVVTMGWQSGVSGHTGPDELGAALTGADLVIIPAGVPRKPGMTRDDLFNINAGIVKTLATGVAQHAPGAILNIISNPVNSTVPIAAETLKAAGVYDKRKVLGVTTLDVVRAETFVAEAKGLDVVDVQVPVIGGHAGETILPLLSQAEAAALTQRIQNAGTEVVEAKAGAGSATLSMAYAAARFAESVLLALNGEKDVVECTFVESDVHPDFKFFASKVVLGPNGVEDFLPLGELSPAEQAGLDGMNELLTKNIKTGIEFANKA